MGDSKQVRVDNWGTYFLQRLQQFFNKTDYCDLTLQFEGNVQLKVHRLVVSACTEYFHILEQTCEMIEDVLIMPPDLQADVILPIVNFMYTGILDFQMSTYDRLYKTAELMNIPILTKLLDAQKKPIPVPKTKKITPTQTWNSVKKVSKVDSDLPAPLPGRKIPVWKRKTAPISVPSPILSHSSDLKPKQELLSSYDNSPKPTRFEWPEEDSTLFMMDSSFHDISYTSKPLLTQEEEIRTISSSGSSSIFDDIKHLPNLNKRNKEYSVPPVDMEAVKDYVKEQKIRSDMVEYDDDDADVATYESQAVGETPKRKSEDSIGPVSKKVRFNSVEKENKETKINVSGGTKGLDVNHTKIISEVLKKYPHLVKKNKNIKVKILAKKPGETTKSLQTVKVGPSPKVKITNSKVIAKPTTAAKPEAKKEDEGPWTCQQCSSEGENIEFVLYYLYLKHMSEVHNERIDSRICKFCGHKSSKHNMLMYHLYTQHGVQPPAAYKFPKCNKCPYIALTEALLVKHKLNHLKFDYECMECKIAFNNYASLQSHMQITAHSAKSGKTNYDCQYCTKRYQHGAALFSHIKLQHREEARRDGVISIDEIEDEEAADEEDEQIEKQDSDEKIFAGAKVESIGHNQTTELETNIQLEPSSEAEALSNVASGIATSLGLVDIVVLDDNQQYILQSGDQQLVTQQALENTTSEYLLPDLSEAHSFNPSQNINEVISADHNVIAQSMLNNSDITSTDELVMVLTDHDYNDGNNEILNSDNSNIVVLYSHPVDGQENQFITSQGNLMLNSQTGMLEIRNAMPPTSTTSQILINPQDTHMESIEMIQREINNHSAAKPTETSNSIEPSVTALPNVIEPFTQNTEMLENDTTDQGKPVEDLSSSQIHNVGVDIEKENMVFNTYEILPDHNEAGTQNENIAAPLESTENCEQTFEEVLQPPTENSTEDVTGQDDCHVAEMEIDEDCKVADAPSINFPKPVNEEDQTIPSNNPEVITNTSSEIVPGDIIHQSDSYQASKSAVLELPPPDNYNESLPPPDNYNESLPPPDNYNESLIDNNSIQNEDNNVFPTNDSEMSVPDKEAVSSEEFQNLENDNVNPPEPMEQNENLKEFLQESSEKYLPKEKFIQESDETQSENRPELESSLIEVQDDTTTTNLSFKPEECLENVTTLQPVKDLEQTEPYENVIQNEHDQNLIQNELEENLASEEAKDKEEIVNKVVEPVEIENNDKNDGTIDLENTIRTEETDKNEEKMSYETEEKMTFETEKKMTYETEEKITYETEEKLAYEPEGKITYESDEKMTYESEDKIYGIEQEDNLQQEETNDTCSQTQSPQENLHSCDENSQSQDDNSQISTNSTSSKEVQGQTSARRTSCEATKNSILVDWEDTDSLPSDQGPEGKTVSKIIDDWEDEEDDENKK